MNQSNNEIMIDIAKEFSPYPAGRFVDDGQFNGTDFRTKFLVPRLSEAVSTGGTLVVDIDGVRSFGSSFLEEAFAGLIRLGLFDSEAVRKHLILRCSKPHLQFFKDEIDSLIETAATSG